MSSKITKLIFLMLLSLLITGCEKEGPMERAGEVVDEAIEDTGEAIEDAQEKMEDAIEDQKKNK